MCIEVIEEVEKVQRKSRAKEKVEKMITENEARRRDAIKRQNKTAKGREIENKNERE